MQKRLESNLGTLDGTLDEVLLNVQMSDGHWELYTYPTESEAGAFVHSVYTYHQTGMGPEWYDDIFQVQPV